MTFRSRDPRGGWIMQHAGAEFSNASCAARNIQLIVS